MSRFRPDFVIKLPNISSVWCRGGTRKVEGCWGFLHPKIEKLVGFRKTNMSCFLIDTNSYSRSQRNLYRNLHYFPVSVFDFLYFQSVNISKNTNSTFP